MVDPMGDFTFLGAIRGHATRAAITEFLLRHRFFPTRPLDQRFQVFRPRASLTAFIPHRVGIDAFVEVFAELLSEILHGICVFRFLFVRGPVERVPVESDKFEHRGGEILLGSFGNSIDVETYRRRGAQSVFQELYFPFGVGADAQQMRCAIDHAVCNGKTGIFKGVGEKMIGIDHARVDVRARIGSRHGNEEVKSAEKRSFASQSAGEANLGDDQMRRVG